ncbi:Sugar transport protein 14 [Spatholobus suberectus]|nr:Sugar transport protein 14 [Spatholobus suberectus]
MAGGGIVDAGSLKSAHLHEYKITGYFIFSCIVGALGGPLFGYDLGVSDIDTLYFLSVLCGFGVHVW